VTLGLQVEIVRASTDRELDAAFASLSQRPGVALLLGSDPSITRGRLWRLRVRAARRAHCKSRAFARLACHRHIAAHHAGELARDGKTEVGAAETLRRRLA
jgi:hypothetical protein